MGCPGAAPPKHTLLSIESLSAFQVQHKGFHRGERERFPLKNLSQSSLDHSSAVRGTRGLAQAVPKGHRQG